MRARISLWNDYIVAAGQWRRRRLPAITVRGGIRALSGIIVNIAAFVFLANWELAGCLLMLVERAR
jgi:hypothetical protein